MKDLTCRLSDYADRPKRLTDLKNDIILVYVRRIRIADPCIYI